MIGKLYVVTGGQYGSEGKGAVAGRIARDLEQRGQQVVGVRVGGPNAGHTVLGHCPKSCEISPDGDGHEVAKHPWRLRQVPVTAVTAPDSQLIIAAGSEVDLAVLGDEISQLDAAGYKASERLIVDRAATLLTRRHILAETADELTDRIGSTGKGIGAARSDRIWRRAETWRDYLESSAHTSSLVEEWLGDGAAVIVEGTQGYGLGLHTDHYPHVTSGDCRAIDFLAQAGISPWRMGLKGAPDLKVVVCYRPYPIRVAGNSGELAGETTWEALGLPVEHTTVTQKVRRVGEWDPALATAAWQANGGSREGVVWAAMTMMDSVDSALAGNNWLQMGWTQRAAPGSAKALLASADINPVNLGYVGTGPDTAIVNERMYF